MNTRLLHDMIYMQCPACDFLHGVRIIGQGAWDWDCNRDAPTISPSILVQGGAENIRCHSFLKAGRWEFLSDCTHAFAGQTVDMVPLPPVRWYGAGDDEDET
ncbi:DUF6527 family protein [Nakamurella lactea]|uniref:DUF6527 family protein n=1 Tax=Nakamurella lactea TaxID=459515 RepID=UPI000687889B|nr:DUF6527 family protein [Nakamurella lactea]